MDMNERIRFLLNKAMQIDAANAHGIIDYIIRNKSPEEIIWYSSGSNEQIRSLIDEARSSLVPPVQQFQQLPLPLPPSLGHGLQYPQLQPQMHPGSSSRGFQARVPLPQLRPLFPPSSNVREIWAPFRLPQLQPQIDPSRSFSGDQAPFSPFNQIVPLPSRESQFYASSSFGGNRAPTPPIGSFPESFSSRGPLQPLKIPGDAMQNVTEDPPSSSSAQTTPIHSLQTLPDLEIELRSLLDVHEKKKPLQVELVPKLFFEKYGESLLVDGIKPEGQDSYSLITVLLELSRTIVIERAGQYYIVLVEDTDEFLNAPGDDYRLVLFPPSTGSNMISITLHPKNTLTSADIMEYFSKYGPVQRVQIQHERTYGHVSLVYPETVTLILAERDAKNSHYVHCQPVTVRAYQEEQEVEHETLSDEEDAPEMARLPSDDGDVVESSGVSNRWGTAPEAEDSNDFGLPDDLGI